jgi:hypothetical protein
MTNEIWIAIGIPAAQTAIGIILSKIEARKTDRKIQQILAQLNPTQNAEARDEKSEKRKFSIRVFGASIMLFALPIYGLFFVSTRPLNFWSVLSIALFVGQLVFAATILLSLYLIYKQRILMFEMLTKAVNAIFDTIEHGNEGVYGVLEKTVEAMHLITNKLPAPRKTKTTRKRKTDAEK